MRKLVSIVLAVAVAVAAGAALGRPAFKKDLGLENCDVCHLAEKKAQNTGNKLWVTAKEHAAKLKAGTGDYAGKTACADCHKGHQKPPK